MNLFRARNRGGLRFFTRPASKGDTKTTTRRRLVFAWQWRAKWPVNWPKCKSSGPAGQQRNKLLQGYGHSGRAQTSRSLCPPVTVSVCRLSVCSLAVRGENFCRKIGVSLALAEAEAGGTSNEQMSALDRAKAGLGPFKAIFELATTMREASTGTDTGTRLVASHNGHASRSNMALGLRAQLGCWPSWAVRRCPAEPHHHVTSATTRIAPSPGLSSDLFPTPTALVVAPKQCL